MSGISSEGGWNQLCAKYVQFHEAFTRAGGEGPLRAPDEFVVWMDSQGKKMRKSLIRLFSLGYDKIVGRGRRSPPDAAAQQ